jgi:hypothetical protein
MRFHPVGPYDELGLKIKNKRSSCDGKVPGNVAQPGEPGDFIFMHYGWDLDAGALRAGLPPKVGGRHE